MRYAYIGNVRDAEGETTFCHACGEPLIVRDGYAIEAWRLDARGCCRCCGTAAPGVFEEHPGDLGAAPPAGPDRAMSGRIRPPAVAGLFYPAEPAELAATVDDLLAAAQAEQPAVPRSARRPARGVRLLRSGCCRRVRAVGLRTAEIRQVVLFGPPHFVPLEGAAVLRGRRLGDAARRRPGGARTSESPRSGGC